MNEKMVREQALICQNYSEANFQRHRTAQVCDEMQRKQNWLQKTAESFEPKQSRSVDV